MKKKVASFVRLRYEHYRSSCAYKWKVEGYYGKKSASLMPLPEFTPV
jgi:hypothetical protein